MERERRKVPITHRMDPAKSWYWKLWKRQALEGV